MKKQKEKSHCLESVTLTHLDKLSKYEIEKLDNLEYATGACITFSIFEKGVGISLIVVLGLIAALYVYLKLFKGKIKIKMPDFLKKKW